MKKLLLFALCLVVFVAALASCSSDKGVETETTANAEQPAGQPDDTTAAPGGDETTPAPTKKDPPDPSKYDFYHVFKAPEGNPRDIVMDYMLQMAKVEWVATEDFLTTWKGEGDFGVNLQYTKGKTYYGVPYSNTKAPLCEFLIFLDGKNFTPYPSPYYEELVGNHCSSSMVMAFQQILDFTYAGSLKPVTARLDFLKFPDGIEIPPSRSESNPDDWISETVFNHNGQDAIMAGYAQLDKGDILYKSIDGSGHTRLVSKVEITKNAAGNVVPARSFVYCVEQTNAWWDNQKNTTWWIDKKYTFTQLYETMFMPVTFKIYHEENPVIEDAYLTMKGKNTPESILTSLNGTVESTFPLAYVYVEIKDSNGKVVSDKLLYDFTNAYSVFLRNVHYGLKLNELPAGTYKYTLRAGIARGDCELESFEFTIA